MALRVGEVVNDEKSNQDILDGQEYVLAVGREGELVAVGVDKSDEVCKCFQAKRGQRQSSSVLCS